MKSEVVWTFISMPYIIRIRYKTPTHLHQCGSVNNTTRPAGSGEDTRAFALIRVNLRWLDSSCLLLLTTCTAPQHLICRAVQSLHINHMQMGIIEVFMCRRLHMNTSMILICIWLICRLGTTLHTKCCGAVMILLINSSQNEKAELKP